jgi:transcriptional regulator with GAF, ATPase, and Fis domain
MTKPSEMVGVSPKWEQIHDEVRLAGPTDAKVLITGESGVGKEVVAHLIHSNSRRAEGRLVTLNCAGVPESLLESELFGHMRGSFTDAHRDKRGLLEQADGGTIFLDEIGELPLDIQAKLLRVLQEKEVERVGGTAPRRVDFRLVAASNLDLKDLTEDGRFRLDLFFRLSKLVLQIPPLREHPEDIALYARRFLDSHAETRGAGPREIDEEALRALRAYPWPGNVRELVNVVERAAWNAAGTRIQAEDLPAGILSARARVEDPSGSTLLRDAAGFRETIDRLSAPYANQGIDAVIGIESRGFILGAAVAERLKAGFVPIRKPGKLPSATVRESYSLEYGTDPDQIQRVQSGCEDFSSEALSRPQARSWLRR